METIQIFKIATSFMIATALYAGALNGLDEQMNDAGIFTARTTEQIQSTQQEINKLITEIQQLQAEDFTAEHININPDDEL
jgi:hypothetical protein